MAYTTTAALKAYLGITSSSDDSLLSDAINRAQAMIDRHCHRHFEPEADHGSAASHVHYFTPMLERFGGDLLDDYTLNLSHDLAELTSITNGDGTPIPNNQVVLLPLNVVPTNAIRIKSSSGYFWTYNGSVEASVQVAGKWSYSLDVPDDIVAATLRLAGYLYRQREGTPDSDRAIMSADGVMLAAQRIPADVREMLRPFIRRS